METKEDAAVTAAGGKATGSGPFVVIRSSYSGSHELLRVVSETAKTVMAHRFWMGGWSRTPSKSVNPKIIARFDSEADGHALLKTLDDLRATMDAQRRAAYDAYETARDAAISAALTRAGGA